MNVVSNNHTNVDQLWYTWSKVGINPPPGGEGGNCIHAASPGLREVYSGRVIAINPYLYYALPATTDRFSVRPGTAPISLVFADNGRERLLLCRTYIESEAANNEDIYFVHLLAGLPDDFACVDAITLWRSSFWQRQEDTQRAPYLVPAILPEYGPQYYPAASQHFLRIEKRFQKFETSHQLINLSKARRYLPWIFQAVFQVLATRQTDTTDQQDANKTSKQEYHIINILTPSKEKQFPLALPSPEQRSIYVAAPADWVAYFLSVVTCILPRRLQSELTFSTYEPSKQLNRPQTLIVGTSLPPSYNEQLNGQSTEPLDIPKQLVDLVLPQAQRHQILNCYLNQAPSLDQARLEAQVAQDLVARLFETDQGEQRRLDTFLREEGQKADLTISQFLNDYAGKFFWKVEIRQDVVELFLDPRTTSEKLQQLRVRENTLRLIIEHPAWYRSEISPLIVTSAEAVVMLTLLAAGLEYDSLVQVLNQIYQITNAPLTSEQLKTALHAPSLDNPGQGFLLVTLQHRYQSGRQQLSHAQAQLSDRESPDSYQAQRQRVEQAEARLLSLGAILPDLMQQSDERWTPHLQLTRRLSSDYDAATKLARKNCQGFTLLAKTTFISLEKQFQSNPKQWSAEKLAAFIDTFNVHWELLLLLVPYKLFASPWSTLLKNLLEQHGPLLSMLIHRDWQFRLRLLLLASTVFTPGNADDDRLVQLLLELQPDEAGSVFGELLSWNLPSAWQSLLIAQWNNHSAETLRKAMPAVEKYHATIFNMLKRLEVSNLSNNFYKNLVQNGYKQKLVLFQVMHEKLAATEEAILSLLKVTPLSETECAYIFAVYYHQCYVPQQMLYVIRLLFTKIHRLDVKQLSPDRYPGQKLYNYRSVLDFALDTDPLLKLNLMEELLTLDELETQSVNDIAYILKTRCQGYIRATLQDKRRKDAPSSLLDRLTRRLYEADHRDKMTVLFYWLDVAWKPAKKADNSSDLVESHTREACKKNSQRIQRVKQYSPQAQVLKRYSPQASARFELVLDLFKDLDTRLEKVELLFVLFSDLKNSDTDLMIKLLQEERLEGYEEERKTFFTKYAKTRLPFYFKSPIALSFYKEQVEKTALSIKEQWDVLKAWLSYPEKERSELDRILEMSDLKTEKRYPLLKQVLETFGSDYLALFQSSTLADHIKYYFDDFDAGGFVKQPSTIKFLEAIAALPEAAFRKYKLRSTARAWLKIKAFAEQNTLTATALGCLAAGFTYFAHEPETLSEKTSKQLLQLVAVLVVPLIKDAHQLGLVLSNILGPVPEELLKDTPEWSARGRLETLVINLLEELVNHVGNWYAYSGKASILLPYIKLLPYMSDSYLIAAPFDRLMCQYYWDQLLQVPDDNTQLSQQAERLQTQLSVLDDLINKTRESYLPDTVHQNWLLYVADRKILFGEYCESKTASADEVSEFQESRALATDANADLPQTQQDGEKATTQQTSSTDSATREETTQQAPWFKLIIPALLMYLAMLQWGTKHIVAIWQNPRYRDLLSKNYQIFTSEQWKHIRLARDFRFAYLKFENPLPPPGGSSDDINKRTKEEVHREIDEKNKIRSEAKKELIKAYQEIKKLPKRRVFFFRLSREEEAFAQSICDKQEDQVKNDQKM
jgi:hypothetical protein